MAIYIVGDVQGRYATFQCLLEQIKFNKSNDFMIFVGDIINRGENSLAMLQWVFQHPYCAKMVLGNHDLHLLAVATGIAKKQQSDTLDAILEHPDLTHYMVWLRHQPLLLAHDNYLVVHAGILPEWSIAQASAYAQEVEQVLQSPDYMGFLAQMYGNDRQAWDDSLQGMPRLRFITNVLTRMRMLNADGSLEYRYKGTLFDAPAHLTPWFRVAPSQVRQQTIVCGHWSALGLYQGDGIVALDTGCIWGGLLTAMRVDDGRIFQVEPK